MNQNHYSRQFTFALDGDIGLSAGSRYLLTEEYPMSCPISEQPLPFASRGDCVTLEVPAYSVRIIRIEPHAPAAEMPRLAGIEGKPRLLPDGTFAFDITGECGRTYEAALVFPEGLGPDTVFAQTRPGVPMYTFPTAIDGLRTDGNVARFQITMPRDRFTRQLAGWTMEAGGSEAELLPEHSDFLGGYIHNLYMEDQYATLFVKAKKAGRGKLPAPPAQPRECRFPQKRRYDRYRCRLDIPFIEWPSMARAYGFDEVIELVFKDFKAVRALSAAIDGTECAVYRYVYPASRDMWTWCIELTGLVQSGTRPLLEIRVEWADETAESGAKKQHQGGGYVLGRQ